MSVEAAGSLATTAQAAAQDQHVPYPSPAVGWYATIMFAFLYWFSVLDRFIISLLVDPIKQDLGLTDVQFGTLHGFAFVISFTVFGLIFGALADRRNRRWLIFIGVSIWSAATVACGVAQTYWHMLLARIGVGVGEASLHPNATSMISDLFPREKLTTAMAVYAIGSTIGSGTALIIGGIVVDWVSHMGSLSLPLIGEIRPWQSVFFIVGLPGALFAFAIFTVPEPVRRGQRTKQLRGGFGSAYTGLIGFIKSHRRFFLCHYAGFTCASAIITGGTAWYPAHMSRSFGWSAGEIGLVLGPAMMAAGIISKLACGRFVDAMYQRGQRDAQMRWYAICMLIAAPIGIIGMISGNPWVFVVSIFLFNSLIGAFQACALTALNIVTPNELRGTGVAVFTTVMGLIAGGIGPVLIAAVSENVFGGEASLGLGLATMVAVCCPLGAVTLLLGLRAMRAAVREADGEAGLVAK